MEMAELNENDALKGCSIMILGKSAQRISSYLWLTSGIILLGMFEAIYRDSIHELAEIDLSLGGCFKLNARDLQNVSITSVADLDYSDSTFLPNSATLSIATPGSILSQFNLSFSFDEECIENITHPIAQAMRYSLLASIVLSAAVLLAETMIKKDNVAKILSTYIWLTVGAMSIGIFEACYRNTLHQLPELDLSVGGCIVAEPGDSPDNIEPSVIALFYDSKHFPPETVTFVFNPAKQLAYYQPILFFKKECIEQITKPFAQALKISFFISMGLSAGIIVIEQWIKNDYLFSCNISSENICHKQLSTYPLNPEMKIDDNDLETDTFGSEETQKALV